VAGDMAGMVLVQGDASINAACTVTAVQGDRVFLCGHPFIEPGRRSDADGAEPRGDDAVVGTGVHEDCECRRADRTITGDHLTSVTEG